MAGECGEVECLCAPRSGISKRRVVLEFDGEAAGAGIVAELWERVGISVWVGVHEWSAMSGGMGIADLRHRARVLRCQCMRRCPDKPEENIDFHCMMGLMRGGTHRSRYLIAI